MDNELKSKSLVEDFSQFIYESPSMFHAVTNIKKRLLEAGAHELKEQEGWSLRPYELYFVTRNDSSIIAFQMPAQLPKSLQIVAAHTDSPTYKIKDNATIEDSSYYTKLDVEAYGGPVDVTWFNKPLGVAGRIFVKDETGAKSELFASHEAICMIPHVAIHLNRNMNRELTLDRAVDLLPFMSDDGSRKDSTSNALDEYLARELNVDAQNLLARDLFVYPIQKPIVWGQNREFITAWRLDDLACVYSGLHALINQKDNSHEQAIKVLCAFDNEEVGSLTEQGASSDFYRQSLERIFSSIGMSEDDARRAFARSFVMSADNAHAVHPNHPELYDLYNAPQMNCGVVIKEAANQHYTTDGFSRAVVRAIAERAGLETQTFANKSNMAGGSTLGNLLNAQVSMHAADIGIAQLAMHSADETMGTEDLIDMCAFLSSFYNFEINIDGALAFSLD